MPVNNNHYAPHLYNPAAHAVAPMTHNTQDTAHTAQARAPGAMAPGHHTVRIHGQPVTTRPLNSSGFCSAFSDGRSRQIQQRARLAINPAHAERIRTESEALARHAGVDLERISSMDKFTIESTHALLDQRSAAMAAHLPPEQKKSLAAALEHYRAAHAGDFVMMNIAAMGYQDLTHYLTSRNDKFRDPEEIQEFLHQFASDFFLYPSSDDAVDEEEHERNANAVIDQLRTRIPDTLAGPVSSLMQFIDTAPRLSGVPLMRGQSGIGHDGVFEGDRIVSALLNGENLRFNGFCSTSGDYEIAENFATQQQEHSMGEPIYTIDLTTNSIKDECLRRDALRALENNPEGATSLLFMLKTEGAAGVSVTALGQALNDDPAEHMTDVESEILLTSGHYVQPEQLIRMEQGYVIAGTLRNGNEPPVASHPGQVN